MTQDTRYVTTRELMDKIEELEARLLPPEPEDFNATLRGQIQKQRGRNSITVDASQLVSDTASKDKK